MPIVFYLSLLPPTPSPLSPPPCTPHPPVRPPPPATIIMHYLSVFRITHILIVTQIYNFFLPRRSSEKKRVTAGEVDKLGKELGNCTHQWDDERWYKHTSAFDTKSSSGERRKIDNNRRKKEAEKRTDQKEANKLNQRNFNKEYVI